MDVGGGFYAWRKRVEQLVERDEVGSISGDRRRGRSRRLVDLLQPDIEEQRRFVLCLGESGSIESFGHDRDNSRPIGSGPDRTAQVTHGRLTVLAAFLASGERRVHQHDRRNRAANQVGD